MKSTLIISPPGYGKNHFIKKYCQEKNYDLVEYDFDWIMENNNIPSMQSISLTGKKFAFHFDGIDNLNGKTMTAIFNFLKSSVTKDIEIFLTANDITNVNKKIVELCKVEYFNAKTENEIKNIFNHEMTEELQKCKNDLRQIEFKIKYPSSSNPVYDEEFENLEVIKLVLYEKDRDKVFKALMQHEIGKIYSWLFESLSKTSSRLDTMSTLNKSLYKLNNKYLSSYLAYAFVPLEEKISIKLPAKLDLNDEELKIVGMIKQYYKCSPSEAKLYFKLLRHCNQNKFFIEQFHKKIGLVKEKDDKKEEVVVRKPSNNNSLLSF